MTIAGKAEQERKARAADLRLGASGMRYFGDYAEAAEMEAEAGRIDGTGAALAGFVAAVLDRGSIEGRRLA